MLKFYLVRSSTINIEEKNLIARSNQPRRKEEKLFLLHFVFTFFFMRHENLKTINIFAAQKARRRIKSLSGNKGNKMSSDHQEPNVLRQDRIAVF